MLGRLRNRKSDAPSQDGSSKDNSQNSHDSSNAEQDGDSESPPQTVGLWDPRLDHVRKRSFQKWGITTTFLMAFILAVLSIYWAVFLDLNGPNSKISKLVIYIVDFDGQAPYNTRKPPLVGPTIVQLGEETVNSGMVHLGYRSMPPSYFNNGPLQVRQAVYNWDAWAAIIINPNATAMLYSAISMGNTSYDPMGACQLVYQDARDETNWYDFILPQISIFQTQATSMVWQMWARMVLRNASDPAVLAGLQAAPQAISPVNGFSEFNLRPFFPYTSIPAHAYLIIISFFSFFFYLPIHMQYLDPQGHPPLKFYQLIIWRYCATVSAYLFLSLAYSFVSMAFQVNFTHTNPITSETQATDMAYGNSVAYGHGMFPMYWMLNFWGMMALGLCCENMAMVVGQPWMGLWLIFWVITNVSTAFYDIEIEPRFYLWGYAWPLHSVVEGSRQILFDLHSRIGLDFGILIAWGVVNTALFPLTCMFQRWKTKKGVTEYFTGG